MVLIPKIFIKFWLSFVVFSVKMILDHWRDPGFRKANPWPKVFRHLFFYPGKLLWHWQWIGSALLQCHAEEWSCYSSNIFQMSARGGSKCGFSFFFFFCIYNSINFDKTSNTTNWNATLNRVLQTAVRIDWSLTSFIHFVDE